MKEICKEENLILVWYFNCTELFV